MLIDTRVLVTGATSGIGRSCALAFAAAGAHVTATGRRADRLEALVEEVEATHPGTADALAFDVRDRAAVREALDGLEVDVLVNNAGLAAGLEPLWESDPDDVDRMLDTNVRGLLAVTSAVVPGMIARGAGHVINIGSIAGHEAYPNGGAYCASKHAVAALTRSLRMDLLGTGVRVSTVDPGLVETEFSVVRFHGDADRAAGVYEGMDPLTPDDVAETVVWVADRPRHVQVAEVLLLPADQASATRVHRR